MNDFFYDSLDVSISLCEVEGTELSGGLVEMGVCLELKTGIWSEIDFSSTCADGDVRLRENAFVP